MEKASIHTMFNIRHRSFFQRETTIVAKALLGKQIVHIVHDSPRAGIIVETEAYFSGDPASHCFKGITKSNCALFGPVGHAYVYFIYGNHYCFNIVAHSEQVPAGGVLIRATEPTFGIKEMIKTRHGITGYQISNGPGKLTQALGITKAQNHKDLTIQNSLFITEGKFINPAKIITTERIGISKAQNKPLRFYIAHNPWVSHLKHM
jgi:DNA-3-methyladenine glycosylase